MNTLKSSGSDLQPFSLIYPQNNGGFTNVLLIDNTVKDAQLFASSANASTFPIIYSRTSTKTDLLAILQTTFATIERMAFVFVSNSNNTKIFLDDKPFFISQEEVSSYSENVKFIISLIKDFKIKNVDYLGCNTLNYSNWVNYYDILTNETGVIVGASNDKTGNIAFGGDWIMESTSQDIEMIYFTKSIEYYRYLLDPQGPFFIAIKTDGTIWGTGDNFSGQLGDGSTSGKQLLTQMDTTTTIGARTPKYISCGGQCTIVLMTDGTIWGTGDNSVGQLGDGSTSDKQLLIQMDTSFATIGARTPQYISCGTGHTIVLMTDGTIWGTGLNATGQLGDNTISDKNKLTQMITTSIIGTRTPKYISCGSGHTIVLMTDGTIWGTGNNLLGQLGNTTITYSDVLTQMDTSFAIIGARTPKYIQCGAGFTIVLMTDDTIWGTGDNNSGQIGPGISGNSFSQLNQMDTSSTIIGARTPKYISCGAEHTIVLMTDGTIWGTGFNGDGQLGNNTFTNSDLLIQMDTSSATIGGRTPQYISNGPGTTYVLMTDDTIWGTGDNGLGQLGTNDFIDRDKLTRMGDITVNLNMLYMSGMMTWTTPEPIPPEPEPVVSDICFPAGTPIKTDQGFIAIENIKPNLHTINKKPIVCITKTISPDNFLIEIQKNALGFNYPTHNTLMSQHHKVFFQGKMLEANAFLNKFNVIKVKYTGEILYNVLMEDYSKISVNNLICETLHPDNIVAKLYTKMHKNADKIHNKIVTLLKADQKIKNYKANNKYSSLSKFKYI